MAELSLQAQAVLDAAIDAYWKESHLGRGSIAAALRAVAEECSYTNRYNDVNSELNEEVIDTYKLLAIAAELEGADG